MNKPLQEKLRAMKKMLAKEDLPIARQAEAVVEGAFSDLAETLAGLDGEYVKVTAAQNLSWADAHQQTTAIDAREMDIRRQAGEKLSSALQELGVSESTREHVASSLRSMEVSARGMQI